MTNWIGAVLLFSTNSTDSLTEPTLVPFIETIWSPGVNPTSAAGVFGETAPTTTGTIPGSGSASISPIDCPRTLRLTGVT